MRGLASQKLMLAVLALGQHGQPPSAPGFAVVVVEPQKIALAHHADYLAGIIHNGDCADAVLKQQLSDFLRRCIRASRDHGGRHNVESIHVLPLLSLVPRRR